MPPDFTKERDEFHATRHEQVAETSRPPFPSSDQPPEGRLKGLLTPPNSFPAFPYPTPYDIQLDFMKNLYECIENRKIGIFESPTGTGKSLSMICGAVGWLIDNEKREPEDEGGDEQVNDKDASQGDSGRDDLPDWVRQHAKVSEAQLLKQEREEKKKLLDERVQRIRERERKIRESMERKLKRAAMQSHQLVGSTGNYRGPDNSGKKKKNDPSQDEDSDDAEYLLDEYYSDQESNETRQRPGASDTRDLSNLSEEVRHLLQSFDEKEAALKPRKSQFGQEEEDEDPGVMKIFYCSRTHSQLNQFIDELRKTSYGSHLHVVSLGSRKTLCINDKMRSMARSRQGAAHYGQTLPTGLKQEGHHYHRMLSIADQQHSVNVNKLNDLCLDAQKSGKPSDQRCEYLFRPSISSSSPSATGGVRDSNPYKFYYQDNSKMDGDEKTLEFRDNTLARIRDIEELADLGKELGTCPYYGARQTVKHCQLVTLPYNLLLHASTRESLKLKIKDNVLLLDEAHNLIDSLLQMHSVVLSLDQLVLAQEQLVVYLTRYEIRLSATNEGYLRVLIRILKCLETFVRKWMTGMMALPFNNTSPPSSSAPVANTTPEDRVMKVNEFLHAAAMDHINLFKAHAYLQKSGVARKLQGLHESIRRQRDRKERRQQQQQQARMGAREQVKIHGRTPEHASHNNSTDSGSNSRAIQPTTPVLLTVDSFLMSLLNADNDGRVIVAMEDVQKLSTGSGEEEDEYGESGTVQPALASSGKVPQKKPVLKFMLLNPANVFRPLVEEARSVILAGGTMEPVSDLLSHLFPYLKEKNLPSLPLPSSQGFSGAITSTATTTPAFRSNQDAAFPRIHRFSCGHVIPKDNLLVLVAEKSPTGSPIELNFANRNQDQVLDAVGLSIVNMLGMIPDGVVVFFVSYAYMAQALARWKTVPAVSNAPAAPSQSTPVSIFDRITQKKRVFIEPKEAAEADHMLQEYNKWIHSPPSSTASSSPSPSASSPFSTLPSSTSRTPMVITATSASLPKSNGAVLFSVVGGKMSEGINFSDRLGRGVIMVGMPYPNKGSPELQERMRYMDLVQAQEALAAPQSPMRGGRAGRMTAGSEYYENLCMRAVNQSIGRAIRHQNDYAVIILLDKRYSNPRIQRKLPGWIGGSVERCEGFGPVVAKVHRFFKSKQQTL